MSGARVLTSAECLAIIKEKENKKKQQEEERENRKRLREEKKKQREEEKQKKAEQRMIKEKEREKQREKKAEEKARKEEERAKKLRDIAAKARAHPSGSDPKPKRALRDYTNVSSSVAKRRREDTEDTDSNKCCVCLQSFEEDVELGFGVQWIQCACERWLHEDCVIEVITDSSGKERLCPFCTC